MPSQSVSPARPHALECSLSPQSGQPGCPAKDRELAPEVGAISTSYVVQGQCACLSGGCPGECSSAVEVACEGAIVNYVPLEGNESSVQGSCEREGVV